MKKLKKILNHQISVKYRKRYYTEKNTSLADNIYPDISVAFFQKRLKFFFDINNNDKIYSLNLSFFLE